MSERACAARLSLALSLPLWDRFARRHLRWAFSRWERRSRILSARTDWARLVSEQRLFLLRKRVLQVHWQRLALAFERWRRVTQAFVRVARRVVAWRHSQLTRLAWAKWRRLVRTERLEEEAAASRCVMWSRKADRLVTRSTARGDSERLVVFWLAWKSWCRRERCKAWRRGMSMAVRKYFVAWQRYCAVIREQRVLVEIMVREVVFMILDDSLAQCLWRQNLRDLRRKDSILVVQGVLQRWSARIQRERLTHAFSQWKLLPTSVGEVSPDELASSPLPAVKVPTFPQRFSAAYREQRRTTLTKPTRAYRRSWR